MKKIKSAEITRKINATGDKNKRQKDADSHIPDIL